MLFVPYCYDFAFMEKIMDSFVSEARFEIFFLQPTSFVFTRCEFCLEIVNL